MDLENGVLSIFGSKGRKDRLVYLPEDSIPSEFKGIEWAFPGANPEKPVSCSGVESCFRRHWAMVAAQTLDKHPTPHCLRHAFVVERFNEWLAHGIDTNKMLPYLSRYLGHKSTGETYYYYGKQVLMESA